MTPPGTTLREIGSRTTQAHLVTLRSDRQDPARTQGSLTAARRAAHARPDGCTAPVNRWERIRSLVTQGLRGPRTTSLRSGVG